MITPCRVQIPTLASVLFAMTTQEDAVFRYFLLSKMLCLVGYIGLQVAFVSRFDSVSSHFHKGQFLVANKRCKKLVCAS